MNRRQIKKTIVRLDTYRYARFIEAAHKGGSKKLRRRQRSLRRLDRQIHRENLRKIDQLKGMLEFLHAEVPEGLRDEQFAEIDQRLRDTLERREKRERVRDDLRKAREALGEVRRLVASSPLTNCGWLIDERNEQAADLAG